MSDSSVMMSESLIDRVDMTKFYDLMSTPTLFSCAISFEDGTIDTSITGFKRNTLGLEVNMLCSQDIVSKLISNQAVHAIVISYDSETILTIDKDQLLNLSVEITYIQDAMCKVKIATSV